MVSKAVLFAPDAAYRCGAPCRRSNASSARLAVLPVGNKPLVQHAIELLVAAGIRDVRVITAPRVADEVQAVVATATPARVDTHVLTHTGTFADALCEVAPHVRGERFLVHLGDSLAGCDLAPAIAGACPSPNDVMALVEDTSGGATPLAATLASVATAGIYVFGPGVLDLCDEPDGPADWELQIAAATERLTAAGGRVELRGVSDWWRFRPRPDALLHANRFFLSGLRGAAAGAWFDGCDIEGAVDVDATAQLTSTRVRGPVIIGARAEIRDAYIGPYTSIAADAHIENAEVENSVVLEGASIEHIAGRLEASVVGPRARIFRDFRLPRAVRVKIGEDAEIAIT